MDFSDRFNVKYQQIPNVFGNEPMPVVVSSLKYVSSGKALDLGVGSGRNTLYLLSKSFSVTGVDSSIEGIQLLKQQVKDDSRLKLVVADVLDFVPEEKFDLIVVIGLLHFLKLADVEVIMERIKSWTRLNGVNVIGAKMTQNRRGDLPYVFKPGEMKRYYLDKRWEIKEYDEGEKSRKEIVTIISKKVL